jgi:hypothetical protein
VIVEEGLPKMPVNLITPDTVPWHALSDQDVMARLETRPSDILTWLVPDLCQELAAAKEIQV